MKKIANKNNRIRVFGNTGGLGNKVIRSAAIGLGCKVEIINPGKTIKLSSNDTSIVWGILRGSDQIIKTCAENKLTWYHIDHAYTQRGHEKGNYRMSKDFINGTEVREIGGDRREMFNFEMRNWTRGGRHILVCPPSKAIMQFLGAEQWLEQTIKELRRFTDREIRIRDKKKAIMSGTSLKEDLINCHAVVTHLSNVAIDAVLFGIPVFVNTLSAAWQVSSGVMSNIENPAYPDREVWINSLMYQQFKMEEFASGEVWKVRERWAEGKLVIGRING